MMPIGFRILKRNRKVSADLAQQFSTIPVANISDSMERMSAASPRIRRMHVSGVLAGPALTVKTRPGDNLMLHKAIDIAEPGDVIVVDAGGDLTNSLIGELMISHAINRGVAGFVIDGAIRDADAIREINLPVYAAGVNNRGPYKDGPGEINVPISLGGMVVEPGDLILGDGDGVLCVPFDQTDTVLKKSIAKQLAEEKQIEAIKHKENDRSWVDKTLNDRGCEVVD